jgi:hypothetical protein
MPIRIWNQPGGPVQTGWDYQNPMDAYTDEEKELFRRMGYDPTGGSMDFATRAGIPETPSGRYVMPDENARLDMTKPGNASAMESIMSRRSPFEGVGRDTLAAAQQMVDSGMSPDEYTARRLSRPRFQTETLETGGKEYDISQMVEPSREDLSRSAEYWKLAGKPLGMEESRAGIQKTLGEAQRESGTGEYYQAQADAIRAKMKELPPQTTFMDFFKAISPSLEGMSIDDAWATAKKYYEEEFGRQSEVPGAPEETSPFMREFATQVGAGIGSMRRREAPREAAREAIVEGAGSIGETIFPGATSFIGGMGKTYGAGRDLAFDWLRRRYGR